MTVKATVEFSSDNDMLPFFNSTRHAIRKRKLVPRITALKCVHVNAIDVAIFQQIAQSTPFWNSQSHSGRIVFRPSK